MLEFRSELGQISIFGGKKEKEEKRGCPLLGGSKCTTYMVRSIGGHGIKEVVRFSESPLLEVSLLYHSHI